MTSKEIVKRAVKMQDPPRIPIVFFNRDKEKSDVIILKYDDSAGFTPDVSGRSEWGFIWQTFDKTMGQPHNPPFEKSWDLLSGYTAPNPNAPGRFEKMKETISNYPDKYIVADLGITGFNLATFIRGFENVMNDLYEEPENLNILLDKIFDFEKEMIKKYCELDIDAIAFYDDWGTQNTLMINPSMWREVFKSRYKEQFELIHSFKKDVFFHSCGQVMEIIPDFIEIGVDILNLNQPDIFGVERLGEKFRGKVCFNCPVDHQTVAINGTCEEIFDYVKRLYVNLSIHNAGFIGNIEEYSSCGMSEENYQCIVAAFESLN